MKGKTLILLSFMLVCSMGAFSQQKKARPRVSTVKPVLFDGSICIYPFGADCYYNPKVYPLELIRNANAIVDGLSGLSVSEPFMAVFKPKTGMTYGEYYPYLREYIVACKLPVGQYWETLRKEALKKHDFEIEIIEIGWAAEDNPSAYKESKYAKYCQKYADAIAEGGEKMKKAWEELVLEQSNRNVDPERIRREYREQANSKDWETYARKELVTYRWDNAMNDLKRGGTIYKINERAAEIALKKLFVRVEEHEACY